MLTAQSWSALVQIDEGLYMPNCRTYLVIALNELSLLFWHVTNTTSWHLRWYEPSYPSTKELHGPVNSSAPSILQPLGLNPTHTIYVWPSLKMENHKISKRVVQGWPKILKMTFLNRRKRIHLNDRASFNAETATSQTPEVGRRPETVTRRSPATSRRHRPVSQPKGTQFQSLFWREKCWCNGWSIYLYINLSIDLLSIQQSIFFTSIYLYINLFSVHLSLHQSIYKSIFFTSIDPFCLLLSIVVSIYLLSFYLSMS